MDLIEKYLKYNFILIIIYYILIIFTLIFLPIFLPIYGFTKLHIQIIYLNL